MQKAEMRFIAKIREEMGKFYSQLAQEQEAMK
jgi:hypothetical protein